MLVLLGKSRSDRARQELRAAALHLKDPTLLLFAVQSLLQLGEIPEATTVERVLASDGQRATLLTVLKERGHLDLAPARWRTQDSLARSVLAHWLRDDGDVRCFPPKIELLGVVPEGERDAYVYRFKTRSDKGAPWLAGLAGLFPRSADPSATPAEGTLSDFEPAESAEPAQHAARMLALIRAENERRAQEGSRADAGAR